MNEQNLSDAATIIPMILIAGAILKHAFPKLPNRVIPLLTWLFGALAYLLKSGNWTGDNIVTAILVAASATGIHSGLKNTLAGSKVGGGKIGLILLCGILSFAPVTFTGCTGPGASRQAAVFLTLKSTQIGVDRAMQVYGTACVTGKVSEQKQAEIDDLYLRYQTAFALAVSAARGNLQATTPADIDALATQLQLLISKL